MKNLKNLIEKLKFFFKLKKNPQKSNVMDYKGNRSQKGYPNSSFLNEHNRKILKRFNKPIVKDLPERKKIFIEVRDVLDDIEARLKNSDIDG